MCGFLSAIITRPGRIFANGLSGHAELAEQHIKRENGIGRQTYWEWEADPRKLPADPLQVRNGEDPPEVVRVASDRLLAELASANGFLPSLPNVAVFRDGSHGPLKSGQVAVMLGGTIGYVYGGHIDRVDGGTIGYVDGSSTVTTYTGVVLNLSDNAVQIDRSGGTPVVHVAEP